jgi:hypothetical protein
MKAVPKSKELIHGESKLESVVGGNLDMYWVFFARHRLRFDATHGPGAG